MQVVLHSDDINFLDYWNKCIEKCSVIDDLNELLYLSSKLIVINYSACTPTVLQGLTANNNRVLVLHSMPDLEIGKELLKSGAMGYGNTLMRKHFLDAAINAIRENMVWLYPEFITKLILDIEETPTSVQDKILSKLSNRESEVALLLKDGLTYSEIGLKLDITPRTVKAHAQKIYSKLNIKDRLSLALLLR